MLSGEFAHYTARLLRAGYLYVYDEHAKRWTGYVVTDQAYLYEFDLPGKPPKKTPSFSCARSSDPARADDPWIARCIMIDNPKQATRIWLGFSNTAWTQDTLDKHASADYRKKHMRSVNVADLRTKAQQLHVAGFDKLAAQVAEYAADGKALLKETAAAVSQLLPKPYTAHSATTYLMTQSREAVQQLPALARDLLSAAVAESPDFIGASPDTRTVAWAFSPQRFMYQADHVKAITAWAQEAARPYAPAMVALDDPAGIAMDLNGLVLQHIAEITAQPDYRWKYETAAAIAMLKAGVCQSAVTKEKNQRESAKQDKLFWGDVTPAERNYAAPAGPMYWAQARHDQAAIDRCDDEIARAGQLSEAEVDKLCAEAWKPYAARIHESQYESYQATVQKQLAAAVKPLVKGLDTAYVGWLGSHTLQRNFEYNYDRHDVDSGHAYTTVARLIIKQASGRTGVCQFLSAGLGEDPSDPSKWVSRAVLFNHDGLIAHVKSAAGGNSGNWNDTAVGVGQYLLATVVAGNENKLDGPLNAASRWIYEAMGPYVNAINHGLDHAAGAGAKAASKVLPEHMQLAMLGAMAKRANPDLMLVDLRGTWTRKQAVKTLAGALAAQAGGSDLMYRHDVRKAFDAAVKAGGERHPFHGLLLLDTQSLNGLDNLTKAERSQVLSGALATVQPAAFDEVVEKSVGELANLDIKAGVVGAVFAAVSFGASMHSWLDTGRGWNKELANLASGTSNLLGGLSETAGKVVKNAAERVPRLSTSISQYTLDTTRIADWLEYGGKVFGVVGGVIAAGVLGYEAWGAYADDNAPLAAVDALLSVFTVVGTLMLLAVSTALWGLALLLIVALVQALVAWLKDDDLQVWLNKCHAFGLHKDMGWFSGKSDYEPYSAPRIQQKALKSVLVEGY